MTAGLLMGSDVPSKGQVKLAGRSWNIIQHLDNGYFLAVDAGESLPTPVCVGRMGQPEEAEEEAPQEGFKKPAKKTKV